MRKAAKPPPAGPRRLAAFEACPKCGGQYHRHVWECQCYLCCFEWDLREDPGGVLQRARRRHQGERPRAHPLPDKTGPDSTTS